MLCFAPYLLQWYTFHRLRGTVLIQFLPLVMGKHSVAALSKPDQERDLGNLKQVSSLIQFITQLQTVVLVQEWGEAQKQVTWGRENCLSCNLNVPYMHLGAKNLTFSFASVLFHKGTEDLHFQQPILLVFCHLES